MALTNEHLVLDLIEWIDASPRPYGEVMDAWRTSCPRLPVWEDAVDHGFVMTMRREGGAPMVHVTDSGREFLRQHRR
jgi:hypothetical protein